MPPNPEPCPEVTLISDDQALIDTLMRAQPENVSAARIGTDSAQRGDPARGRRSWLDLETCAPVSAERGGVFFYARPLQPDQLLPSGLFIRKPCSPAMAATLWSLVAPRASARRPATSEADAIPGWLARLHLLDLRDLCHAVVTDVPAQLGYAEASLYLHDAEAQVLTLAEANSTRPVELAVSTCASGASLMAAAARTGRVLRTDDAAEARRELGVRPDAWRDDPEAGLLVAPLIDGEHLWGVLNCSGLSADEGAPAELGPVVRFIARALRHACEFERARLEARVDALTGLFNYRWLTETLAQEVSRAQRYGAPLSILMIDLDGLKSINDSQGHLAGDLLLRHVAGRIRAALRQIDSAARTGGDEFVVLLPATGLAGGSAVAQRLLAGICEHVAPGAVERTSVSVSIGVAEWQPGWSAEALLQAADQALYAAKRAGRGRVACH